MHIYNLAPFVKLDGEWRWLVGVSFLFSLSSSSYSSLNQCKITIKCIDQTFVIWYWWKYIQSFFLKNFMSYVCVSVFYVISFDCCYKLNWNFISLLNFHDNRFFPFLVIRFVVFIVATFCIHIFDMMWEINIRRKSTPFSMWTK